jgi:uncharacterized protein (DUF58 family)
VNGRAGRENPTGDTAHSKPIVCPVRPLVPIVSCAGVLLAWWLVAHNSGAGWVQAVGDVLAGVLAVGLIAPAVVVARATVTVFDTPSDGTAGLPVELSTVSNTRVRARPVHPPGPEVFVGPHRATPGAPPRRAAPSPGAGGPGGGGDGLTLLAVHRGVHDRVVVEVASAAPFGLLWWRKTVVVRLPRVLHVGPRLGKPLPLPPGREDISGSGYLEAPVQIGEPRGVRPYRPGDHRRWVHWPATAHSGELMVREMEGPTAEPVTVEVRLPADADAAERMAERALATIVAVVDRGGSVLLSTTESGGPKLGAVGDRRSAGRRLARAVADPGGAPSTTPSGEPTPAP